MNETGTILKDAIAEVNEQFADVNILYEPEFLLLDTESSVDSVALVNLFILLEEAIEEKLSKSITIINEDAMEREDSPFRSVGSLEDYIGTLIQGD